MAQIVKCLVAMSLLTLAAFALTGLCSAAEAAPRKSSKPRMMYNLDYDAMAPGFFGPVTPESIDACVDYLSSAGVTDLFVCVCNQRANFNSKAWEPAWDGYDPKLGDDQPFFTGVAASDTFTREFFKTYYNLYAKGCDYPQRFMARTRKARINGWLSMRMNDCHYGGTPIHPYHSKFWRDHPQWWLTDGNGAGAELDYAQPEVREHYLSLIRELCERYDLDGIELDYMRFPVYFHPGQWRQGGEIMTGFVRDARAITNKAAKRLKHPVRLGVKIDTYPWTSHRMGLDADEWAKQGLVDLVTVSPWYTGIQNDVPVEEWRCKLAGTKAQLAVCLEGGLDAGSGRRIPTPEEARGFCLSALHRGADSVYLFNWYGDTYPKWPRADYNAFVKAAGTYAGLANQPRRHPFTAPDSFNAEGEHTQPFYLPTKAAHAIFFINIGPAPTANQNAYVEIVTDGETAPTKVLLNGVECKPGAVEGKRRIYESPSGAASEGANLVTVDSDGSSSLTWVEIAVR